MRILSITKLKELHDVSQHKKDSVIESSIEAVEIAYIKKYFGDSIYCYLLENINTSPVNAFVETFLNGGIYETEDGSKKYFAGIYKAIALLTFSDLLIKQTIVTRFGSKNKTDAYSETPSFVDLSSQISRYLKTANLYIEDADLFLRKCVAVDYSDDAKKLLLTYSETCNNKTEQILTEWI